jgi:hypothetical protein
LNAHHFACCLQDLLIYDEEGDQLKHISFEQALYATGAGTPGLTITDLIGMDKAALRLQLPAARDDLVGTPEEVGVAAVALAAIRADDALTIDQIVDCVKAGIWMPLCITIVRPFIEHLMMSTICTVSGRDTGATLFGPADMQISANTSVKTIEGALRPLARLCPPCTRTHLR